MLRGTRIHPEEWYREMWETFKAQELSLTPFAVSIGTSYETLKNGWRALGIATFSEVKQQQKFKKGRYMSAVQHSKKNQCRFCGLLCTGDICEWCQIERA